MVGNKDDPLRCLGYDPFIIHPLPVAPIVHQ